MTIENGAPYLGRDYNPGPQSKILLRGDTDKPILYPDV